jgi:hypothetical protein
VGTTRREKILKFFRQNPWNDSIKTLNRKEFEERFPNDFQYFKYVIEDQYSCKVYSSTENIYVKRYNVCPRCVKEHWTKGRKYCDDCRKIVSNKKEKEKGYREKNFPDNFIYNMY